MLFASLCVVILVGALLVKRAQLTVARVSTGAWSGDASPRARVVGAVVVVAGALPLLSMAPFHPHALHTFTGDAASHAEVAQKLATQGLPHGWVDSFTGFPFGHHYPPLGWLLLAGLMRTGASAAAATYTLGWLGCVALPLAGYRAALRARARPGVAAAGSLFLTAVSPYNPFVGGYEAFFTTGLVSQVLALPLVVLASGEIARAKRASAVLLAALAMAAHPEVSAVAIVLVLGAAAAAGRREALVQAGLAVAGAAVAGAALYGQGILALEVPFGWPPDFGWRALGFGFRRWNWWLLDGDLLDRNDSAAPLTALAGASVLVLVLCWQKPAARAALMALGAALLSSSLGPALARLGRLGELLLSFVQPLRVLALMPLVAAAVVVVALEQAAPLVTAALERLGAASRARWVPCALVALALAFIALALPNRVAAAHDIRARWAKARCSAGPAGYDAHELRDWLARLRGGRLWFEQSETSSLAFCAEQDGLVLASAVPLAITSGVGSHVGIQWLAARRLEPSRAGSARRAEALGIRYLLGSETTLPGWHATRQRGEVSLLTRDGGADLVAVGCVVERWRGRDATLRARLVSDLNTAPGADRLLDPARFTALEHAPGDFVAAPVALGGCDPTGAHVSPVPREPGALEANVELAAPADIVFRATAFPTWRVTVDGAAAEKPVLVAPGFFTVRVPAGRHRVIATVSSLPGYVALLTAAALALAALAFGPALKARVERRPEWLRPSARSQR